MQQSRRKENNDTQPALKNYMKWLRNIQISPELHRVGPWQSNNDYYAEEDEDDDNEESTHLLPTIDQILAKKRIKSPAAEINSSQFCQGAVRQQSLDLRESRRIVRKVMPMRQLLGLTLSPTNQISRKPKKGLYLEKRQSDTNISQSFRQKTTATHVPSKFSNQTTQNIKALQQAVVYDQGTLFTDGEQEMSQRLDDHDKSLIMGEYMQTQSHRLQTLQQPFANEYLLRKQSLPTQVDFDTPRDTEKLIQKRFQQQQQQQNSQYLVSQRYLDKVKLNQLGYSKYNSLNLSVEQGDSQKQLPFDISTMREQVNTSSTAAQEKYFIRKNSILLNQPALNMYGQYIKAESILKSQEIQQQKSKILPRPRLRAHHYYQQQQFQQQQQQKQQNAKKENISLSREIQDEQLLQPEKIFPKAPSNSKFIQECAQKRNKYSQEYRDVIKKICRLQRLAKVVNSQPHKKLTGQSQQLSQQQIGEKDLEASIVLNTLQEQDNNVVIQIESQIFKKQKRPDTETLLESINKKALMRFLPNIIKKINQEYRLDQ